MKRFVQRCAAGIASLALPLAAQALEYDVRRIDLSTGEIPLASIVAINNQGQLAGLTAAGQVGILTGNTLNAVSLPFRNATVDDLNDQGMLVAHDYSGTSGGTFSNIYTYTAQGGLRELQASKDEFYVLQGYPKASSAGHVEMHGAENGSYGGHGSSAILTRPDGSYVNLPYLYYDHTYDVNASGVVVGASNSDAVYWDAAGQKHVVGKQGGAFADLEYVTDSGLAAGIAGILTTPTNWEPGVFIYSLADGQTRFIDGMTTLSGIDEAGRVYGKAMLDGVSSFVVWEEGQFTNLSVLLDGTPYGDIRSVSSDGRVLIGGAGGLTYVLTPTPEPGTYVLMGIGLTAAAWGARRRRAA